MSPHNLESISISSLEVEDILKTLKTGKAAGPDFIDNRPLKTFARPLSAPLTDLFNLLFLKVKSRLSGNRPMSQKHVYYFLNDHYVITTLQSGFVPGDSTVNQLVDIYNTFCQALDEGKEVHAIFLI